MNNQYWNLPPALQQAVLKKLEGIKPDDGEDLSENEIDKVVADVLKNEENVPKKVNLNKYLSSMESGLYCETEKVPAVLYGDKGVVNAVGTSFDFDLLNGLFRLGIVGANEKNQLITDENGKPKIIDAEKAGKLVGKEVHNWDEFYSALLANSYSYEDDISQSISEDYLRAFLKYDWLLGPISEYATAEDYNNDEVTGERYILNTFKIENDFAEYIAEGNKIETIEDMVKALDWLTHNTHTVNGKIDEAVSQSGTTGDCWLMSGMLSLASTDAGRQAISDAMKIEYDSNGNLKQVTVEFKGAYDVNGNPVKIVITADEINKFDTDYNSDDYLSNGDNDMLVLELASNKLEEMIRNGSVVLPTNNSTEDILPGYEAYDDGYKNFIEGSLTLARMITLLTGVDADNYSNYVNELTRDNIYAILSNAAENDGTVLNFGLTDGTHRALDINDEDYKIKLNGGHAFAITDVTEVTDPETGEFDPKKSTVTFVNPWDSTEEITMTWMQFVCLDIGQMSSVSLNGQAEGTTPKPEMSERYVDLKNGYMDIYESFTEDDKFTNDLVKFLQGDMTIEQFRAILKDVYNTEITSIVEQGENTIVTFTDIYGTEITVTCNTKAVNDGVKGNNGKDLTLLGLTQDNVTNTGLVFNGVEFSFEEFEEYFTSVMTFVSDGETYDFGYYAPANNWPEGVETLEELRAYLDSLSSDAENDYSDSPFADILNAVSEENSILKEDINNLLENVEAGDIESLFDLKLYGLDVGNAIPKEDGTFDVTVTLNGASYTFNFEAEQEDELIEAGLLTAGSVTGTRGSTENDETSSIDNRTLNDEFTLAQMQEFIGSHSTIWSYLTAIPPKDGGTIPTFKVNTELVKQRFPERNIRTMKDLKDAILNPNKRAGTRDDRKPKPFDKPTPIDDVLRETPGDNKRPHLFIR